MEPLSTWALDWGVVLADGLQLTEKFYDDWTLTITEPVEQGSPILTVPSHVILTSDIRDDAYLPYYDESDMRNVYTWMSLEMGEEQTIFQQNYLPEFMLIFKLLREVYLGKNSRWYVWWQSLPQSFSTGLYLDNVERKFVECMADEVLCAQELQLKAFLGLMRRLLVVQESRKIIPSGFYTWLLESQKLNDGTGQILFESLIKWAFTVVFTRSWRSPDQQEAQIVPLGDLVNHDSQMANLQPLYRPIDGAVQFFLTRDVTNVSEETPGELFLSYGLIHTPVRYLVLFGFCDVSAAYVDAHLDFLDHDLEDGSSIMSSAMQDTSLWPMNILDRSRLVISTTSGAISEEVWIAFLYKVLCERDPGQLAMIRNSFEGDCTVTTLDADKLVDSLLEKWELTLISEMQKYYQRLLETDFAPIIVTEQDLLEHPNLSMIVTYNLFMRECFVGVLKHLSEFSDPAVSMQNIGATTISTTFSSQYSANSSNAASSEQTTVATNDGNAVTYASVAKQDGPGSTSSMSFFYQDTAPDSTMDSYAQAFNSMKLSGKASVENYSKENLMETSRAHKFTGTSFDDSRLTSQEIPATVPITTTTQKASPSEDGDTSMDAYIRAINMSNGVTKS
jgi:hypothetical protein